MKRVHSSPDGELTAKRVFLYLDRVPTRDVVDGAGLRYFSNAQAWLDVGYQVEAVEFASETVPNPSARTPEGLSFSRIMLPARPPTPLIGRIPYRAGLATRSACNFYFPEHSAVLRAASQRARRFPEAFHFFEHDGAASAAPFLRSSRKIYSCHDIARSLMTSANKIACQLEHREPNRAELREIRFRDRVARRIIKQSDLTLCISPVDLAEIRSWAVGAAEHLPMSIPSEELLERRPSGNDRLEILHVGALGHLPSYRSLEFIFERVIPLLDTPTRAGLSIRVAGKYDLANPRCRRIVPLIESCPEATLLGFVPDIAEEFARCDLQIVASSDASGLQTRIIESFARGLPVLATALPARGVDGLEPGRNLILAESPEEMAREITQFVKHRERLSGLANAARETYLRLHSRQAVAARLRQILSVHFPN